MSFYLILEKAKIHKVREVLWNPAEIKFYSFVADSLISLPGLDQLLSASNPGDQRSTIREMARFILDQWTSVEITNIRDGHIFKFGDTGKILYRSDSIPDSLDWLMLTIEIDEDVRSFGEDMGRILPDEQINSFAQNIINLATTSVAPQITAAFELTKILIKSVTYFLKKNENDQLGLIEQSFVREIHYPEGKRIVAGEEDQTGNMWYDYQIFGVEE